MPWGIKYSKGMITKAGNVIRLKVPNTKRNPRMLEDTIDERLYYGLVVVVCALLGAAHSVVKYSLYEDQAPQYHDGLDTIAKSVRLIRPCYVGARNEDDCNSPLPRTRYQLVDRPILKHEARNEHKKSQGVVGEPWRYVSAAHGACPQPAQHLHGDAIDRP